MDLSRRGFIAAVTSTLATAVPLSMAATLKPPVVPVPPAHPGHCRDCNTWSRYAYVSHHPELRLEGYCSNHLAVEIGMTSEDFGCTLFKPKLPPPKKPDIPWDFHMPICN